MPKILCDLPNRTAHTKRDVSLFAISKASKIGILEA